MTTVPALSGEAALNQYVATGGQTDFNFSFMIFATADIEVYVNGVLKTEVTDYTVKKSGGGSISSTDLPLDGGKVVFVSGLTLDDEVTLNRNVAIARSTGYSVAGAFRADVVNAEFTKGLAISQQLRRDIERSIRLAAFDSEGGDLTLPTGRASKLIGFDANSDVALFGGVTEQIVPVSTFMATVLDDTTAAAALTTLGVSAFVQTLLNDADAAAALTTLGVSAFVQTLLNDADAAAAQATLGFPTLASGDEYKMLQIKADRSGYNAVEAVSRRNAIINGAFNIWQRNTSFTSVADGTYTADRWYYLKSGAMVHDVSRSTDVPTVAQAGRLFNYSILVDCQTIDNSIAAGDYCFLGQIIEGYNWLPLAQKALTLSFWVKATKTGTYCISLSNTATDRSYIGEYTVSVSDTWEYKTVSITASPSAGTWDYTNSVGIRLNWSLTCGSTRQGTAGQWNSANVNATSNQVNACDSTSNNFRLAGVQLEVGSLPTPFEHIPFARELISCQRYYEKSYDYGTALGASTDVGSVFSRGISSDLNVHVPFKVSKRATPTVTLYSTTGASGKVRDTSGAADRTASAASSGENMYTVVGTSITTNNLHSWHHTASAEL